MSTLKYFILLGLLVVISQACEEETCRELQFPADIFYKSKRLIDHLIKTFKVTGLDDCELKCRNNPDCISLNIKPPEHGKTKHTCELNNSTAIEYPEHLKDHNEFYYRGGINWCGRKGACSNGATCQSGYTEKKYRCVCKPGFRGPRCQQAQRPCEVNVHTCMTIAICVSKEEWSYECKCPPGYVGDGDLRSGYENLCKDVDECANGTHNCSVNAFCNNTKGSFTCTCEPGYYGDGNNCTKAYASCKEYPDSDQLSVSKVVPLLVGSKPIPVLCHFGNFGCGSGAWTPVMKINGSKGTFRYDSQYWSNTEEYNLPGGETGFDLQETKLPTYWNTPFTKICLGMMIGQQLKFTVINKQADSLYSLIADGQYRATTVRRFMWEWLIGSQGFMQRNCNKEGFNAAIGENFACQARIGIFGDEEYECDTCDSRIGFGTTGSPNNANTCGYEKGWATSCDGNTITAMGYIIVQ